MKQTKHLKIQYLKTWVNKWHTPHTFVWRRYAISKTQVIIIIIYPLTMRVVGTPQMASQPVFSIFPCSPLPSGTWQTPGLSIPDVVFLPLPLSALSSFPFYCTVPCKMVLARPDEPETCPYYCSLRHFTVVRRSLCGPVACWILAR